MQIGMTIVICWIIAMRTYARQVNTCMSELGFIYLVILQMYIHAVNMQLRNFRDVAISLSHSARNSFNNILFSELSK